MTNELNEVIQLIMPLIAVYLVIIFAALGCGIANYVFRGAAIYTMSANRGISNGWLGFIPYAHNYQLGKLAGEIELGNKKVKKTGVWLLVMPLIYGFIFIAGYIATMLPFFITIFSFGEEPSPEQVMSAMPAFMIGLFIFVLILIVAQVFLYLFRYLALHKIFSLYSGGQKPVFYLILSLFVPLAQAILLFKHRNRPLLETTAETAGNGGPL